MAGQGMRMTLKGKTPSAHARLKYITRVEKYAKGIDGPRNDLAANGSGNLPNWADDADQFWQGVDQFERTNARRCVELELNLPPELTLDQQQQVVKAFAERLLGAERLPHTWAIHGSDKNPHCHLMFQERGLDGVERPNAKAWFKRADTARPERGGAVKSRRIHGAAWAMHARATWAETVNDGLQAAGHDPRFDHRSKAVQRDDALRNGDLRRAAALGTLTERHEGAKLNGMRRRVERGEIELEKLPGFAQQLIQQNDQARAYNNKLRDWVRSAPDAELAEQLAPDLAELAEQLARENPGAHVATWKNHQQQLDGELAQDAAFHAAVDAAMEDWGGWPELVELPSEVIDQKARLDADRRRRQAEELELQLKMEADQHRAELMVMLTELHGLCVVALELGFPPEVETFRKQVCDWLRAPDACPHSLEKLIGARAELRESVELRNAEQQQQAETEDSDFWEQFAEAEAHYERSMTDDLSSTRDEPKLEAERAPQAEPKLESEPGSEPKNWSPRTPRMG